MGEHADLDPNAACSRIGRQLHADGVERQRVGQGDPLVRALGGLDPGDACRRQHISLAECPSEISAEWPPPCAPPHAQRTPAASRTLRRRRPCARDPENRDGSGGCAHPAALRSPLACTEPIESVLEHVLLFRLVENLMTQFRIDAQLAPLPRTRWKNARPPSDGQIGSSSPCITSMGSATSWRVSAMRSMAPSNSAANDAVMRRKTSGSST